MSPFMSPKDFPFILVPSSKEDLGGLLKVKYFIMNLLGESCTKHYITILIIKRQLYFCSYSKSYMIFSEQNTKHISTSHFKWLIKRNRFYIFSRLKANLIHHSWHIYVTIPFKIRNCTIMLWEINLTTLSWIYRP